MSSLADDFIALLQDDLTRLDRLYGRLATYERQRLEAFNTGNTQLMHTYAAAANGISTTIQTQETKLGRALITALRLHHQQIATSSNHD